MRKLAVILVVLLLLCVCGTAQSENLQGGWYAEVDHVALFGWEGEWYRGVDWNFVGGLGVFAPFEVTEPSDNPLYRKVLVISDSTGVSKGTGIDLEGEPAVSVSFRVDAILLHYTTFYDAEHMKLQMLVKRGSGQEEVLWQQNRSGLASGTPEVLDGQKFIYPGDTIALRVSAVPEPTSMAVLSMALTGLLSSVCRRRRRA